VENEDKIILYRSFDTVIEAYLAKTKLDAYGVPCFLTEEHFTNLYPIRNAIFPGVRLHIFEKDRGRASEVLRDEEDQEPHASTE
jgi:Putative prokaryotic signal transducing protein